MHAHTYIITLSHMYALLVYFRVTYQVLHLFDHLITIPIHMYLQHRLGMSVRTNVREVMNSTLHLKKRVQPLMVRTSYIHSITNKLF